MPFIILFLRKKVNLYIFNIMNNFKTIIILIPKSHLKVNFKLIITESTNFHIILILIVYN